MTYTYINTTEGVGQSAITAMKGGIQFVGQTIDKSLDPSMGVTELGAVAVLLAIVAVAFAYGARARSAGGKMLHG